MNPNLTILVAFAGVVAGWTACGGETSGRRPGGIERPAPSADRVDFDTQIIPVLTKSGCNAGACHGAAIGRGGFKLSLYGGDPAADYAAIVHELEGRRVNLAFPEESLLLRKPSGLMSHGGGMRFDLDGDAAALIRRWITAGAPRGEERRLVEFRIEPASVVLEKTGDTVPICCLARFSDGSGADVTRWTVFTPEDDAAVRVKAAGTRSVPAAFSVLRRGTHVVIARYLDRVVPVRLTVPLADAPVDLSREPRKNFIDEHVLKTLETLRLMPAPPADDPTFLRRVRLDLTGRLPAPDEVREFLADERADKRDRLVEKLLESDEFVDCWTYRFAKLLRIRSQPGDKQAALTYHNWLREQLEVGTPWDRMARELVTATGDTHQHGPANFYRTAGDARAQAEFFSELFMGARLRCANCHNHPLDRWTQDDYHGLAAVFAKIERGRVIKVGPRGEVTHPATGEPAVPRIPGARYLEGEPADGDGRTALAGWLTNPENPYFARAIVNRLWKVLMGRGLVEPADDLRTTNPATHPELLKALADDFVRHGYDIRHTLRLIATSGAYARGRKPGIRGQESKVRGQVKGQRSRVEGQEPDEVRHVTLALDPGPSTLDPQPADDRWYSRAIPRPLEPEVLADAIADVTGVSDQYGDELPGTRAVTLFDPNIPSPALDILGRCSREDTCESSAGTRTGGMSRTLHLINGPLLNRKIASPDGRLHRLIAAGRSDDEIVEEFYLRALNRPSSPTERRFWKARLEDAESAQRRSEMLEDFLWSLLSCREFVTRR